MCYDLLNRFRFLTEGIFIIDAFNRKKKEGKERGRGKLHNMVYII